MKVQWDSRRGDVADSTSDERDAYQNLVGKYQDIHSRNGLTRVTGPLTKTGAEWVLHVREFEIPAPPLYPNESYDQSLDEPYNDRPGLALRDVSKTLGFLNDLAGTWIGTGFNVVTLPDFDSTPPSTGSNSFRLRLDPVFETLEFNPIGGAVPNRGANGQRDINIYGLRYLQRVSSAITNEALHIEPGFWLNVPSTTVPDLGATVVRQGTIPHGNAMLAVGTAQILSAGPEIDNVDSTPTTQGPDAHPLEHDDLEPFRDPPLPPGFKPAFVRNPNLALKEAIEKQNITRTVTLTISTTAPTGGPPTQVGGIVNMPFDVHNANATRLDATFWIETVEQPDGSEFFQLQYTQTVILDFDGIDWPHISVATLTKQ